MLSTLLSAIAAPPADAFAEAQRHLDGLTKPPGSLGRLDEIAARLAERALDAGADLLATGEMGIGNTTAASAITAAITGAAPERVTGRGTGVDDTAFARKVDVVRRALAVNAPDPGDGVDVLAGVGGFEIAGLVGVILVGATRRDRIAPAKPALERRR